MLYYGKKKNKTKQDQKLYFFFVYEIAVYKLKKTKVEMKILGLVGLFLMD